MVKIAYCTAQSLYLLFFQDYNVLVQQVPGTEDDVDVLTPSELDQAKLLN